MQLLHTYCTYVIFYNNRDKMMKNTLWTCYSVLFEAKAGLWDFTSKYMAQSSNEEKQWLRWISVFFFFWDIVLTLPLYISDGFFFPLYFCFDPPPSSSFLTPLWNSLFNLCHLLFCWHRTKVKYRQKKKQWRTFEPTTHTTFTPISTQSIYPSSLPLYEGGVN